MAERLAIFSQLKHITQLVNENQVTWVIVDTGCGKSVGIPYDIIRTGGTIVCTQPTIPAATSLYEYQKKLSPNFNIGFAAEGEKRYDGNTNCLYATAGHIRKVMLGYFKNGKASDILFCHVLMVDEVHTGSKDNSIILDLWREARRQGVKVPRLLLSTATAYGLESLMEDLGGSVFRNEFRHFKVQTRYHTKDYDGPDNDDCFSDATKIILDLFMEKSSHGIVFCSGSGEVDDMVDNLTEGLKAMNLPIRWKVCPCYSQCKREEIEEAIRDEREASDPCFKIVVATNICESSLTIPDAIFVVDMMTEKRAEMVADRFHLKTTYISKNSADQRKGRTGRTLNGGVCYRMCTEHQFNQFEDFRPVEMIRTPASDVVIELMTKGLDPAKVITELSTQKLEDAKQLLIDIGSITIKYGTKKVLQEVDSFENEEFPALVKPKPKWVEIEDRDNFTATVTQSGRFVASMPMDPRISAGFYDYISKHSTENVFWPMMYFIMADVFGPSLFWMPRKNKKEGKNEYRMRLEEHKHKYFDGFIGSNPLESLIFAFHDCIKEVGGGLDSNFRKVRRWSVENSCNNKKLKELFIQAKRIGKILSWTNITPKSKKKFKSECDSDITIDQLRVLTPIVIESFLVGFETKLFKNLNYGYQVQLSDGKLGRFDVMKSITHISYFVEAIPISEIHFIDNNTGREQIIINLWLPLKPKEIEY